MRKFSPSFIRRCLVALIRPWLWSWRPLRSSDLLDDPIAEFEKWFDKAVRCIWLEFPEAMCLSTIGEDGYPDGRMVLLKEFDNRGFVFYTNFESVKGRSLEARPQACLTFFWEALQRQVRVQGEVEVVSKDEADAYFASRARLSQVGAWASKQSQVLSSRDVLDNRVREYTEKFEGQEVPRPIYWNGFRLKPKRVEFWKLRFNRLHDRFVYAKEENGHWSKTRLYP